MSAIFPFEYFCGANVSVRIGELPIMEAAGISYSISEGKRPIYGYSDRYFRAVARGRVLVQGKLVINYIHQDYLFHAIEDARNPVRLNNEPHEVNDYLIRQGIKSVQNDFPQGLEFMEQQRARFWDAPEFSTASEQLNTYHPHDLARGLSISVVYGEQDEGQMKNGRTAELLQHVHFISRGKAIQIDEQNIVEVYDFIARDIRSLTNPYRQNEGVEAEETL